MFDELIDTFIMPIKREYIFALSRAIDDIKYDQNA
jgi:uncharacterized protein Yka (UPF0111/DUF47 family)